MKQFYRILLFVCCLVSLFISLHIFYNQGIAADELNLSAAQLFGGSFWLSMTWLRMLLLLIATILSFIGLLPAKRK